MGDPEGHAQAIITRKFDILSPLVLRVLLEDVTGLVATIWEVQEGLTYVLPTMKLMNSQSTRRKVILQAGDSLCDDVLIHQAVYLIVAWGDETK